ncbi:MULTISPECIES: hypothetical protein [unclassified Tolypothrix]|uniref:hypothetical protein n=1 Tax=unclassified Tolypothrix TaxID=2649714 RepID=UPI0005F82BCE|nr:MULTISPECIES: hypothetical protein [unclassified Tolypothrix]MBE9083302.1 hypothetical protein [Tolypothrix sp. LEGE 11397]UYD25662.1 hypothetical protein HGR01_30710 [Tolypothrix sp. PCC 7712]UYD32097.1 hypothetical protein HG267_23830 [Tolypothrix sp. PCC 7601]BAY91644.1 hypothetical protein NIES3275_36680 [Microchaete diplosiphon NIES-3275]
MRHIFFSFLLPISLVSVPDNLSSLDYRSLLSADQNLAAVPANESFYTTASRMVQQQIDLIARIEQAMTMPDANRMRSVQGQLTVYTKFVDAFLNRQYKNPKTLCISRVDVTENLSFLAEPLTESQIKIYCSLYASNQELLKLTPVLDRLLSRRGELALVRPLPLVSGERQSDSVLAIAPMQLPNLDKLATPFAIQEPNLVSPPLPIIGRTAKTAIADYVPLAQPAIAPPAEALTILADAKKFLTAAQVEFPLKNQFTNPQETSAVLDHFSYDIDPQEPQIYATFLKLPRTGIFRVLPDSAYQRPLDTIQNRLAPTVSERYPFPLLADTQGGFTPSLALQLVGDHFALGHQGVDYSFMVDLGDIPLTKLDSQLQTVVKSTREFFLNYQPPKQLDDLQVERRRFLTGKDQNWNLNQVILASAQAQLNHTYLVRSLQFQLPDIILNNRKLSPQERQYLGQAPQLHSSDILLAFRPVRRRADGSYTVLWRVLNQFHDPTIIDLQQSMKY